MKTKTIVLSLFVLAVTSLSAGPGDAPKLMTDYIRIVDALTGEPLIGVEVRTQCAEQVLFTDPDGMIELPHLSDQSCDLELSYISYEETKISIADLGSDKQIALVSR